MNNEKILWVDDEIEMLKPHIIFIKSKGYEIETATNGHDAIDMCRENEYDLIFLDENMPGLTGLETLTRIKEIRPNVPIVMITKSEEENIMDMAIGQKISDYLIKPVNPKQILLSIKKHLHKNEIIAEAANTGYQQNFSKIDLQINDSLTVEDWKEVYKQLVYWELELENTNSSMNEVLKMQKTEANKMFARFISRNYIDWINNPDSRPVMSPDIMKKYVFPHLDNGEKVFLVVLDNFRYDQWKVLSSEINEYFSSSEDLYFSILPTATQYSRNSIFSGLYPAQIAKMFPDLWVDEDEEEGKNLNEEPLVKTLLERYRRKNTFTYNKIYDSAGADRIIPQIKSLKGIDLNVIVVNFIDMMSHARTESKMIRELASTEAAYRSITKSWFIHSSVKELFAEISKTGATVILTTDHGSIKVNNPVKVVGDRNTNTNLRYKLGKNLGYNPKEVFEIKNPEKAQLPSPNVSTSYIFASGNDFFAYPNNYNYYVSYYKDTFQHGGISMEEVIIPAITLKSKNKN